MKNEANYEQELQKSILEYRAKEVDAEIHDQLLKKVIADYVDLSKELENKIQEVTMLSITDPLTKIYNRLKFNNVVDYELKRAKRYKKTFSIILFDIDHFKKVNDTYGHDVGDITLITLAQIVKKLIRDNDTFARWGGEEFILIVPETPGQQAVELAEKIRSIIQAYNFDTVNNVTCSFGVSEYEESDDSTSIIKRADEGLYDAKLKGRNRVVLYEK